MNTDYGITPVAPIELALAFGSARAALAKTGGDLRLALFYVHNRERIASAPDVRPTECGLCSELRAAATREAVVEAWCCIEDGGGRPTVAAVARECGFGWARCKRLLVAAGVPVRGRRRPE
jgi:hypothetical protein